MQKWEYLYLEFFIEPESGNLIAMVSEKSISERPQVIGDSRGIPAFLDDLGFFGWELVGVSPKAFIGVGNPDYDFGWSNLHTTLYFKRPKE